MVLWQKSDKNTNIPQAFLNQYNPIGENVHKIISGNRNRANIMSRLTASHMAVDGIASLGSKTSGGQMVTQVGKRDRYFKG